jgi:hypothetical protein
MAAVKVVLAMVATADVDAALPPSSQALRLLIATFITIIPHDMSMAIVFYHHCSGISSSTALHAKLRGFLTRQASCQKFATLFPFTSAAPTLHHTNTVNHSTNLLSFILHGTFYSAFGTGGRS